MVRVLSSQVILFQHWVHWPVIGGITGVDSRDFSVMTQKGERIKAWVIGEAFRLRCAGCFLFAKGTGIELPKRAAEEIHAGQCRHRLQLAAHDGCGVVLFGGRLEHGHEGSGPEQAAACPLIQPRSN